MTAFLKKREGNNLPVDGEEIFADKGQVHLLIILAALSFLFIAGAVFYYLNESKTIRQSKSEELKAIADLKISQITQWQKERHSEAVFFSQSDFIVSATADLLSGKWLSGDSSLFNYLKPITTFERYEDILIMTPEARVLFSMANDTTIDPLTKPYVKKAVTSETIYETEFYYCPYHNKIHDDIIAPIKKDGHVIGLLLLRNEPYGYLYPLIQSWPTPSKTAESMLVTMGNDSVVYLNELRHRTGTALTLKLPLDKIELAAVQAINGYAGFFEGRDYRDKSILAYINPVPGTRWFMIAKVDKAEILSELRYRAIVVIILAFLLVALSAAAVLSVYRSRQGRLFKVLYEKEKKLTENREEYRIILYSLSKGVMVCDIHGNIIAINNTACQMTGYREEDVQNAPAGRVFVIEDGNGRRTNENPVQKVIKTGMVIDVVEDTWLISRKGNRIPLAYSISPVKDESGNILRVVVIFRDRTRELESQRSVMESERKYRDMYSLAERSRHALQNLVEDQKLAEEEIRLLNDRLEMLVETIKELSSAQTIESVNVIVSHSARKLINADGATLVFRDNDLCYYADEDAIAPLWKGKKFPINECISGWVMLNKKPVIISDIYKDDRIPVDVYKPTFVKSLAMVPVNTSEPVAAIGNYWKEEYIPSSMEISLLQTLADAASRAIENIRLYNELEERVKERTARLQAVNTELETFTYSVSHDLKAPLRGIDGYSKLLLDDYKDVLTGEAAYFLETIRNSTLKMNQLIDDLLDYSRMERSQVKFEPFKLRDLIESTLLLFKDEIKDGHMLSVQVPDITIVADLKGLSIAIRNLLENAVKFSRPVSNPIIEVMAEESENSWLIRVNDNGIGFDMKYSRKIFDIFQRLHREETYPGTGIGLAMVARAVHKMQGKVWAESNPGKGAAFFIEIPKKLSDDK